MTKKVWIVLSGLLLISFFLSLNVGALKFPVLETFLKSIKGVRSDETAVLWQLRFPRTMIGLLLGGSLGLAGAAMQGLLRNPLAEPGVMGVTGGAVFGAVLMLYTGVSSTFSLALPLGGLAGALVTVILLYMLSGYMTSAHTLILAGVAINTFAFSGTSLALNLAPDAFSTLEIVFWQMGSLADRSMHHLYLALPFVLAGVILLLWDGRALDALSLGEETATSLGVPLHRVRFRIIFGTALCVGAVTSVCGSIGFVGLVVPNLLRPFVGNEPGKLLGVSAVGGAILILWADLAIRLIHVGAELKLGVLTSLLGAPFFLLLMIKMRRNFI